MNTTLMSVGMIIALIIPASHEVVLTYLLDQGRTT